MNYFKLLISLFCVINISLCVDARPNFIIFQADDLGYGDLNSYGHPSTYTPNIDELYMDSGIKFTQAIHSDSVCSPNRASILTSKYPIRLGFAHDYFRVIFDSGVDSHLPTNVSTFAQILKNEGYSTNIFGKWHLGINRYNHSDSLALPLQYGFDYYYGIPYGLNPYMYPDAMPSASTLYENDILIQQPTYVQNFTTWMNEKIIQKIYENEDRNFLLYINYLQPHTPLVSLPPYVGATRRGSFGDDLLELDDSVGLIVNEMKKLGLDDNTVYIFTSDNGPYGEEKIKGGSGGILKSVKGTTWDGGHRVPFIIRYKGISNGKNKIHQGSVSVMDVYPTMLDYAGIRYDPTTIDGSGIDLEKIYNNEKSDHRVKGKDRRNHNFNEPTRILFHYCGERVLAIRYGQYKIHLYTQIWSNEDLQICEHADGYEFGTCLCRDKDLRKHDPPLMFNIEHDPSEKYVLTQDNFDDYEMILANAYVALNKHIESIIPVDNQLDQYPDDSLEPCCNYPLCCCNHESCDDIAKIEEMHKRSKEYRDKIREQKEKIIKESMKNKKNII